MTVSELSKIEGFSPIALPEENREIKGVYIGDLLSWVMGRAGADNAWITIMSNINTVAVATLADTATIILAEGVTLENDVCEAARSKGINVLTSPLTAYEIAVKLNGILKDE